MSDTIPISRTNNAASIAATRAAESRRADAPATSGTLRNEDAVEISRHAQLLSRLRDLPEIREDLVQQARARIASGEYDTPETLDRVIERLAEEL